MIFTRLCTSRKSIDIIRPYFLSTSAMNFFLLVASFCLNFEIQIKWINSDILSTDYTNENISFSSFISD